METDDDLSSPATPRRPAAGDRLERRFAVLGLVLIVAIGAATALLLSRFLTSALLESDAAVGRELVDSVVAAERSWPYFTANGGSADPRLSGFIESFFERLSGDSGMLRANVYAADRTILWSSTPALVGRRFDPNPELDAAFAGQSQVDLGRIDADGKAEHLLFGADRVGTRYVESYIPVRDAARSRVIGAIELYRQPEALLAAIDRGLLLLWGCAAAGALILHASLYWMVRRAGQLIRRQQRRLVETETMAAVGELAAAVAHGLRNPLAGIRSSAELALLGEPELAEAAARDILGETDRLNAWIGDLLRATAGPPPAAAPVALDRLLRESLEGYGRALARQGIELRLAIEAGLPPARAHGASLGQVLNGLIANALEAMPGGGRLTAGCRFDRRARELELRLEDDGPGLVGNALPRGTTKPGGLGLGLALGRRIVARQGGSLALTGRPGRGAAAVLRLPAA